MLLLARVVRHKETFYPSAWARYDLARLGSLRLAPPEHRLASSERDYQNRGVMIFGEVPAFDRITKAFRARRGDKTDNTETKNVSTASGK
jgi:hypothetical protein